MNFQFQPSQKIILALDGMNANEAMSLVAKIPKLSWVKVGLELYLSAGPDLLMDLRDKGKRIFLDLKFHDIPSTMFKACKKAAQAGAELITVHACSGSKALSEAQKGAEEGSVSVNLPVPTLLGVTVLTSWGHNDFKNELLFSDSLNERVNLMAHLAFNSGIGGCICSPLEVGQLRRQFPEPFELITPGIRLPDEFTNDQVRIMTPLEAISSGASKLVVGRPITKSIDPSAAFEKYCEKLIVN